MSNHFKKYSAKSLDNATFIVVTFEIPVTNHTASYAGQSN